jgi:hypothetical protein
VTGFTPFQLIYGRQAKLPVELKITTFQDEPMTFEEALMKRALNIINKMQLDRD